jgi:hypothetical protein
MAQIVRGLVPCAIVAAALFAVGCGGDSNAPSLAPAKGKVLLGGSPLNNTSVLFIGEKGHVAMGMTGADGVFYLTTSGKNGAPVGKCKVGITVGGGDAPEPLKAPTNPQEEEEYMEKSFELMRKINESRSKDKNAQKAVRLSEKYGNPEKSGLTAEVAARGDNDFVFHLVE